MYDFSGYATKNNIRCSDGRIIRKDSFKHLDGAKVPLVYQHQHNDPNNVLGHVMLENREDGVYAYGTFNETSNGVNARKMVEHGDVVALSIYANQLKQVGSDVTHGEIREVSLVLAGANPGALIDNVVIRHSDDTYTELQDEAIIFTGDEVPLELYHGEGSTDMEKTVQEVFDTLTPAQADLTYAIIAHAMNEDTESFDAAYELAVESMDEEQLDLLDGMIDHSLESDSDDEDDEEEEQDQEIAHGAGGTRSMKKNIFDSSTEQVKTNTLSHDEMAQVLSHAQASGVSSLRNALLVNPTVLAHAADENTTYGINNLEFLFPTAHVLNDEPDFIKRRTEWVSKVLGATKKSPFSRIKTVHADITADEARAKGYIRGTQKIEEVFALLQRETTPYTIYKKQKLDRDDIIDVTTIDLVRWLKTEMRIMFDEERARAILIGDGRSATDPDKIKEDKIRPIYKEDPLYAVRKNVTHDPKKDTLIDEILRARKEYKGTGTPDLFVSPDVLTDLLLLKDTIGHRLYKSEAELAAALRVRTIVEVEPMENVIREETIEVPPTEEGGDPTQEYTSYKLHAIMVNLVDYTEGADKGGEVSLFDDFDIDFNQYKYLMESRQCGALTKPHSAVIFEQKMQ